MDTGVPQTILEIRIKDFPVHLMGPILGCGTEKVEIDKDRLDISFLDQ